MNHAVRRRVLDEHRQQVLDRALQSLGLGDEEGRRIFLLALGYELDDLVPRIADRLAEPPPPRVDRPAFCSKLERGAQVLSELISSLGEAERATLLQRLNEADRFGHRFETEYLDSLNAELTRLAAVCATPEPPAPPDPASDPLVQQLVGLIAKAYDECFESVPSADVHGPFARLLATIFRQARFDLPVTSRLIRGGLEPEYGDS